jgi:acyl-CoA synthetase (AMP-forming)/AMP-acid ligase II
MLTINESLFSADYFDQQYALFDSLSWLPPEQERGQAMAVCLAETACWLALCFYAKTNNLTVMPIVWGTPKETAQKMAEKAGCNSLIFADIQHPIALTPKQNPSLSTGLIQMSSGTTGEPKCICRSWQEIDREIASYTQHFPEANNMQPVVACPVTHSYGLICGVLVTLARGQAPVIVNNINPKFLVKILKLYPKPLLYCSPTMLATMIRFWPQHNKLHAVMTSGTVMSQTTFELLSPQITHMLQQYGCSEAGCVSMSKAMSAPNDLGTPLPHMKISSSNISHQPKEIIITMQGTGSEDVKTIHTQDMGYTTLDTQGKTSLRFVSRMDDTIIVAGFNVYPQEIEDIILAHPHIADVVVFKVNDQHAGQRVALQYVADIAISPHDLRAWCQTKLASYQVPQYLEPLTQIARLANGKINRKQISLNFSLSQTNIPTDKHTAQLKPSMQAKTEGVQS